MPARTLETPRYTATQIAAVLASPVLQLRPRFELYTAGFRYVDSLRGVSDAEVQFDFDRAIPGVLRITFRADERLRRRPFQFYIVPWFGIVMPDGGTAEWPMGWYVFMFPKRRLYGKSGVEIWQADCGDLMHVLDQTGPDDDAFKVNEGSLITDGLGRILGRVGIADTSGIAPSDEEFASTLSYTEERAARLKKRKTKDGKSKKKWVDLGGQAETWELVANDFCEDLGYLPPHFSLGARQSDGHSSPPVFQAQPTPDWSVTGPDHRYSSRQRSTWVLDRGELEIEPDEAQPCNRVRGRAQNKKNETITAEANLNDLIPEHPLAERNLGHYITNNVKPTGSSAWKTLGSACQAELFDSLSYLEQVTLHTAPNPAHDYMNVVELELANDPELSTPELFLEKGWTLKLFQRSMTHDLRRLYRISV